MSLIPQHLKDLEMIRRRGATAGKPANIRSSAARGGKRTKKNRRIAALIARLRSA